jgi:hypothetical protein
MQCFMKLWLTYHSIVILGAGGFGQIYCVEEKKEKIEEKIEGKIDEKTEGKTEEKTEEKTEGQTEGKIEEKIEGKSEEKIEDKIEDKSSPEIVIKIVLRDKTTESSAAAERNVLEAFSNHKRLVKNIVSGFTFLLRS